MIHDPCIADCGEVEMRFHEPWIGGERRCSDFLIDLRIAASSVTSVLVSPRDNAGMSNEKKNIPTTSVPLTGSTGELKPE